ncbi:MAG: hypothetical protein AAF699_16710 [Pseudomonadota bacterium]
MAAFRKFSQLHNISLVPESPGAFQDGSLLTCAVEYEFSSTQPEVRTSVLGGFYFSRYGDLFCGGGEPGRSRIDISKWNAMQSALEEWYGFTFVTQELLAERYSGEHPRFRAMDWDERYFAPWYVNLRGKSR